MIVKKLKTKGYPKEYRVSFTFYTEDGYVKNVEHCDIKVEGMFEEFFVEDPPPPFKKLGPEDDLFEEWGKEDEDNG